MVPGLFLPSVCSNWRWKSLHVNVELVEALDLYKDLEHRSCFPFCSSLAIQCIQPASCIHVYSAHGMLFAIILYILVEP